MKKSNIVAVLAAPALFFGVSGVSQAKDPPLITQPKSIPDAVGVSKTQLDIEPVESPVATEQAQVIRSIHFAGGTVIGLDELSQQVSPLINQAYSVELVTTTVQAITQLFQDKGYPLSFATVTKKGFSADGQLTITLIEGHIAREEVQIEQDSIRQRVNAILAPLKNEKPLTRDTLERAVLLLGQIPGYTFNIGLPRPKTLSGATSIRVEVKEREWVEPGVSFSKQEHDDDNLYVSLKLKSLNGFFEQFSVSGLVPLDGDDERYYAVGMDNNWLDSGLVGRFQWSRYEDTSDSRLPVGNLYVDVDQDKTRDRYQYTLEYPIWLTVNQRWKVGGGIYHTDEKNDYELSYLNTMLGKTRQHTRYSSLALNTNYYRKWQSLSLFGDVRVKQGVDLGGRRNDISDSNGTRQLSQDMDFTIFEASLASSYQILQDLSAIVKANGVYTDDELVSSERVTYGGQFYGRGYPEGQAEGDKGYGAELKLLYNYGLNRYFIKPYVVVDTAHTEFNTLPLEHDLSSYALGVELGRGSDFNIALEYAVPFGDDNINTGEKSDVYNVRFSWKL
ncbi:MULTISPECIES: ShlB/FhaC/HecB family hemolysin secretion/activation protein [unclassified Vibrio]|uniref:ShlB/FhaC/HecB family hemolysin secretion/activation protein n=1 Tax=unclassified Vibrio TaxID=2614977 RepID=UPI001360F536|nr:MULTISPECIES: ShlB/FhaC/HecB family hemolysin secretion/activation protein [unclassified Vibrio]NAW57161.1 hypothetical protein [Vibrio sp. V36_P2S2PM302]NAX24544.1 hypothetical protein [Vibrio sp. V38_P2S17PM301]NAX31112.1 hypothetical protein [Vibrio sp. V37_P2S8PM304]